MRKLFLIYKPYFREISVLSYPIIIGQMGIVLMGVADVIMVGRIDAINLAAASLANSIYFLVAILGIGTLTAVSPLVAKARGEGHPNQCAILFRQGIIASLLLSACIGLILYILAENLHWFGQTERVALLTRNYLHVLNAGTLPLMLFNGVKQYSDGLTYTKPAAIISFVSLLLNVFLNYLLIFGNWGLPAWGLFGSGVATSVSRLVMALLMLGYVFSNKRYKPYMHLKQHEHDAVFLKQVFRIGLPSGFQYFFEIAAFAFSAIMIGWISEYALAAHQVAINIASVTYMLATGISAGGSIAVGNALGRKNKTDIIRSGNAALIMGAVFMGCCAIIFMLFNKQIIHLYIDDVRVYEMASYLLFIAALFQLSDGIQCVGLGVLRGVGDTKIPTAITVIAYWVIGIPAGYLLCFYYNFGLYGIWYALLLGLTLSAVLLTLRFIKMSRKVNLQYAVQAGIHEV